MRDLRILFGLLLALLVTSQSEQTRNFATSSINLAGLASSTPNSPSSNVTGQGVALEGLPSHPNPRSSPLRIFLANFNLAWNGQSFPWTSNGQQSAPLLSVSLETRQAQYWASQEIHDGEFAHLRRFSTRVRRTAEIQHDFPQPDKRHMSEEANDPESRTSNQRSYLGGTPSSNMSSSLGLTLGDYRSGIPQAETFLSSLCVILIESTHTHHVVGVGQGMMIPAYTLALEASVYLGLAAHPQDQSRFRVQQFQLAYAIAYALEAMFGAGYRSLLAAKDNLGQGNMGLERFAWWRNVAWMGMHNIYGCVHGNEQARMGVGSSQDRGALPIFPPP